MLLRAFRQLEGKRRVQLGLLLGVMMVSAAAEMATIGSLVPLLSLASTAGPTRCALPLLPCGTTVPVVLMIFSGAALLSGALRIFLTWFSTRLSYGIGADLGFNIYRNTLHEPYLRHVQTNSSEIISDILKVDSVVAGVLYPAINVVVSIVLTVAIVATLMRIDLQATSYSFLLFALLYVVIYFLTHKQRQRNATVIAEFDSRRIKAVQEGLGGIRDVLLDGTQRICYEKFDFLNRTQRTALAQNSFISQYPRFVVETVGMLAIAAVAGYYIGADGSMGAALPVLGALALGAQRLLPQIQMIYTGCSSIKGNFGLLEAVVARLEAADGTRADNAEAPAPTPHPRLETATAATPILELVAASFSYASGAPPVIRNVSLRLGKGSKIGFVGRTGSGKSTLLDLLMGLLLPAPGALIFNGMPITSENVRLLQNRIAHVPQSIFLTDASISENIAFGVPPQQVDFARVKAAADRAQASEFIDALPDGFRTHVGERGIKLSGGQKQRIGIARALYKDADILILDEATSALDDATEAAIVNALHEIDRDITVLIVAHRTSTLLHCDLVYEIEEGCINREGKYDEFRFKQATEVC
jgi:ATP-binding cassette, subfamily B, bacterial PglK